MSSLTATDPECITVVLLDDDAMALTCLESFLTPPEDIQVLLATRCADQMLELLESSRVDVLITDIHMENIDGAQVAREALRVSPETSVILLTTVDTDDSLIQGLSAGASGFLLKDTRTAQLHQALRAVDSGDAILTPRITRELLNRHMLSPVASPRQRAARQRLDDLSPREREVADLVAQGLTNAEIAQRLVLAPDSVKKNVTRILTKLDLRDRVQLVILMRDAQS